MGFQIDELVFIIIIVVVIIAVILYYANKTAHKLTYKTSIQNSRKPPKIYGAYMQKPHQFTSFTTAVCQIESNPNY